MNSGDNLQGYILIEPIAEGGMGTVWKAKHPNLDRLVAVKCIRPDLLSEQKARNLFVEEVKHLSQLHSPQVVQVLDSGVSEANEPFMVTEFLSGEDLSEHLDAHGAVEASEACRIGIEVLRALTEAHALGIVHGDLKPSNIFLMSLPGEKYPAVKVLDFGVASLMEENYSKNETLGGGEIRGSLQYMAPEQLTQAKITAASDIYTFGSMLYRLLTNRHVFIGESEEQIRYKLTETPVPPSSINTLANIPETLDHLVLSCLEKRPQDRPSSASALRRRLELIRSKLAKQHDRTKTTTALDASVPDWLQSGFSQSSSDTAAVEDGSVTLSGSSTPAIQLDATNLYDEQSVEKPLPPELGRSGLPPSPQIELDVSRTIEQAAPTIGHRREAYGSISAEIDPSAASSSRAEERRHKRQQSNIGGMTIAVLAAILAGGAGYLILSEGENSSVKEEATSGKQNSQLSRKSTSEQLEEGKALLEALRKSRPEKTERERSILQEQKTNIVLILPKNQKGRFVNGRTGAGICPSHVQSCRVPRNIDVLIRAPGFQPRRLSSATLLDHDLPSLTVKLRPRPRPKQKK